MMAPLSSAIANLSESCLHSAAPVSHSWIRGVFSQQYKMAEFGKITGEPGKKT